MTYVYIYIYIQECIYRSAGCISSECALFYDTRSARPRCVIL